MWSIFNILNYKTCFWYYFHGLPLEVVDLLLATLDAVLLDLVVALLSRPENTKCSFVMMNMSRRVLLLMFAPNSYILLHNHALHPGMSDIATFLIFNNHYDQRDFGKVKTWE